MKTFRELYEELLMQAVDHQPVIQPDGQIDPHHLDCLLNPDRHAPVWRNGSCGCSEEQRADCRLACDFAAISDDGDGDVVIIKERCVACNACVEHCVEKNLVGRVDVLPVLELLRTSEVPVYAMIAPAFISQFSDRVTPGKLRTAFKKLGFAGMIEVALTADILTLKEAYEFDRLVQNREDFLLTSCCCPLWIALIRTSYNHLLSHIPPSTSPMAACGRIIKKLYPAARTVFIGPCIAKKAEARMPDIADAVDHVLTFQEINDVFKAVRLDPADLEEDLRDHSSAAGRQYARVKGVSEAVQATVDRIRPGRPIPVRAEQGDGMVSCKELLKKLNNGEVDANYIEGMGCIGGCVGGPKSLIDRETALAGVERYTREATNATPADNPYVIELLHRLGFDTPESLLEDGNLFVRHFQA
jgi:iron only hydrogenase large subunit-like protein